MLVSTTYNSKRSTGFTLPAILVVVGALMILAVGLILFMGLERKTARSFTEQQRADLAARAGLEDIRNLLSLETANDDFMVIQSQISSTSNTTKQPAGQLFIARGRANGSGYTYRYIPLFSALTKPVNTTTPLSAPAPETYLINSSLGKTEDQFTKFTALPYNAQVHASWLPIKDDAGLTVARYAFWVEDLQARIDPSLAGNDSGMGGTHSRAEWPFPAAGVNPAPNSISAPPLDQIAVYSLAPKSSSSDQGKLQKTLITNRNIMISPDSALAAAGIIPPLERLSAEVEGKVGQLSDPISRAAEEALVVGHQTYTEQSLIPYADGIKPITAGKPKLNLNQLLSTGGGEAVNAMAKHIDEALPNFVDRKGGFPDNYLKTLAANALDYADADQQSTRGSDYRGIDAYPLISEFIMRFEWENTFTENGRKYIKITAATYVELWNMTDQSIEGDVQITHDARANFSFGANPEINLQDQMSNATPALKFVDGFYWYEQFPIKLNPNEYSVKRCGIVTYKIDAGPSNYFVPSPLILEGETYGRSGAGYKLKWNGAIVDQARGGLNRNDSSLNYSKNTATNPRHQTRMSIPGHSYKIGSAFPGDFRNNMGDPRMAYYINAPQDGNSYPHNYSPNRRNVRWGTIYSGDSTTKPLVQGRVMPSEWPDGGHNSSCESVSGLSETNKALLPNDSIFIPILLSQLRNPPPEEAPMRLSSSLTSRYYSATELGRVYDPLMYKVDQPSGANLPWGDVTGDTANSQYGGGNTLRIGRLEHPYFDRSAAPGMEAYHLLDLFHAGISRSTKSTEREGPLIEIRGHLNINTANRDALRALMMGPLTMDPMMAKRSSEDHNVSSLMAPPVIAYKMPEPEIRADAERIADAIIAARQTTPFVTPSTLSEVRDKGVLLFGNKSLIVDGDKIHRSDSAAEEIFARIYEASTVRSRNFRIWVVGQAIAPSANATSDPQVYSEVRKAYTVFADPGSRQSDGSIIPANFRLKLLHETNF